MVLFLVPDLTHQYDIIGALDLFWRIFCPPADLIANEPVLKSQPIFANHSLSLSLSILAKPIPLLRCKGDIDEQHS
jgi:hypothetical protein